MSLLATLPFPDISPEIFSISIGGFEFALRWYALSYIAGILIGWRLAIMALRRPGLWGADGAPLSEEAFEELMTWVIVGVIVGGRLGSVLFYNPGYYLQNPGEVFILWRGGMSFHGGFLGVVAAAWIFATRRGISRPSLGDLLAMATPTGLLLGRLANFINAELWGRPTDAPWGIVFPGEAALCAGGIPCARHPSQLYEAGLEGLLLGALLLFLVTRRGAFKTPGLISGLFVAGYGAGRFTVEFFRLADAKYITPENPFGHVALGMTMGQILSLPMIAAGLALALWALRTRAAP